MELGLFLDGLKTSLMNRGIPPEVAARHVAALGRTFTEDDLTEIESIRSPSEIDEIADSIAAILYKNKASRNAGQSSPPAQTETSQPARDKTTVPGGQESAVPPKPVREAYPASDGIPEQEFMPEPVREAKPVREPAAHPAKHDNPPVRYAQNSDDFFKSPAGEDKTTKGVAIFWTVLVLTLPLTLGILAVMLAAFGILFLGLIVMIIGLVLGMIALIGAGCGVALVGIIYGITQLFSFMAAGIYEIGLGVMIGGGVLLAGIILYNLAIRFLPWVMKWLTVFFVFVFGQCRNLFYLARRECYKL